MRILGILTFALLMLLNTSCGVENKSMNKSKSVLTSDNWEVVSVPVVEKHSETKNGKVTTHTDYYLQRSMGDYFIKFCESEITREEFEEEYAKSKDDLVRAMTLEIQIKKGQLDDCLDSQAQSRIGEYVVVRWPNS